MRDWRKVPAGERLGVMASMTILMTGLTAVHLAVEKNKAPTEEQEDTPALAVEIQNEREVVQTRVKSMLDVPDFLYEERPPRNWQEERELEDFLVGAPLEEKEEIRAKIKEWRKSKNMVTNP